MSGSNSYGTTSVPAPIFTDAGFVAPSESDILAGALADMNSALGGNMNTGLSTPQGQLATTLTAIIGDQLDQELALLNGVDPARAFGRMQDAIGYLYFMTRKGATATVVTVVCSGAAGAVVPAGTLIQDGSGYYYAADGAISINATGTGAGSFSCTTLGAIACPANSLSLYQSVTGLTSVANPTAGVVGQAEEGRVAFEQRRAATVEANAVGVNNAIKGVVMAVPGVTDCYVVDNSTSQDQVQGGVTLAPHSLYVCVNGGADDAIAQAIISKKPPGCGYTGTTSVTITDPNSDALLSPKYTVAFTRAVDTALYFSVTLSQNSQMPSTAETEVQSAILSVFSGMIGSQIGTTVYASQFYAAVAALGNWVQIVEITIGTSEAPTGFVAALDINQIPTLDASSISLIKV